MYANNNTVSAQRARGSESVQVCSWEATRGRTVAPRAAEVPG